MVSYQSCYQSWGRFPKTESHVSELLWPSEPLKLNGAGSVLPYGQGRSYGDQCLNAGGTLLSTRFLDRLLSFDPSSGVLRCEAGTTLDQILAYAVPRGWFLPVTPGTKFVSIGGAIANDVHGKNHHVTGTFGRHVRSFELLRSDGSRRVCSESQERELFCATIAGMGLTGLITWAEIQLQPIKSAMIEMQSIKFRNLTEFHEISAQSSGAYAYSVAWLDCVSSGSAFGRGIFMRGNHSERGELRPHAAPKISVPFDFPCWALNRYTISAFNTFYYNKQQSREKLSHVHYDPFFYPLDSINNWNRIYGKRGFFQFQCVVPPQPGSASIEKMLRMIVDSGQGSFLAVLKEFGTVPSPGLMSFPRPGTTLCLDFAHRGESTLKLMQRLDDCVREQGGAIYPAKDACMSARSFKAYFPRHAEFAKHVDSRFSSSFWRRVNERE